jgi:hypothetical protein
MRFKHFAAFALAAAGLIAFTTSASAAPPSDGWDDVPDVIIGGGSDTTYQIMNRFENLYSGAPGCVLITASNDPNKGKCVGFNNGTSTGNAAGNWDHDVVASAAALGSGAGKTALCQSSPVQYNPTIHYARSSSGPGAADTDQCTYWAYARDAIAVITFGTRSGVNLTKAQIQGIYNCSITNWNQIPGQAAGTIIPWKMNTSSGTYATFMAYLGFDPNAGACTQGLPPGGTPPFENDVKPLLSSGVGSANDYLWWMSFANFKTYPFTTGAGGVTSNLIQVDSITLENATITDGTYPIPRSVFHVTRTLDADCHTAPVITAGNSPALPPATGGTPCNNAANTVYGTNIGGTGGAVRMFTTWLCRATGHTNDTQTGLSYSTLQLQARSAEGFVTLPASLRTPGYSCGVG